MNKKCPNCHVVNFINAVECVRCGTVLDRAEPQPSPLSLHLPEEPAINRRVSSRQPQKTAGAKFLRRAVICATVCLAVIFGFYLSLLMTSKPVAYDEKRTIKKSIEILEAKGFENEVFLLRHLTSFRGNDNWLNASTRDENAYAATNFPFEIITIYPEFFTVPLDDTERAMILLHEAQHLKGADEREAYEFVWRSRKTLGWTRETHGWTKIYINVERQTREFAPDLFRCEWVASGDCTE